MSFGRNIQNTVSKLVRFFLRHSVVDDYIRRSSIRWPFDSCGHFPMDCQYQRIWYLP